MDDIGMRLVNDMGKNTPKPSLQSFVCVVRPLCSAPVPGSRRANSGAPSCEGSWRSSGRRSRSSSPSGSTDDVVLERWGGCRKARGGTDMGRHGELHGRIRMPQGGVFGTKGRLGGPGHGPSRQPGCSIGRRGQQPERPGRGPRPLVLGPTVQSSWFGQTAVTLQE